MVDIDHAEFVSVVTSFVGRKLDRDELCELFNAVPKSAPAFDAANAQYAPAFDAANAQYARELLAALASDRKVEAIKYFRALTGDGLKDSKDAVERVMNRFAY